jgi:arsenite/tail-anchored protein-transporting ATPase
MAPAIQFFIGKGGVGKSTTSALTALTLASASQDTLLVSMDPAHNQRDIFQEPFSEKPKQVMHLLSIKEVDTDYWIKTYLKDTESQLKKMYSYQSAFNIQNYYRVLKYSPGLEEYAMLLAFENILHTATDMDTIIFDMPPTALTLRFFSLPLITLVWLKELLLLRNKIFEKKEIVSKIKLGHKIIEQDKVKNRLGTLIESHNHLRDLFIAKATHINLVLNNDPLSLAEAIRIQQKLNDMGIKISSIILNNVKESKENSDIAGAFNGYPVKRFPHSSRDLYGMDALKAYILENSEV